jgi:hypothetical protein
MEIALIALAAIGAILGIICLYLAAKYHWFD